MSRVQRVHCWNLDIKHGNLVERRIAIGITYNHQFFRQHTYLESTDSDNKHVQCAQLGERLVLVLDGGQCIRGNIELLDVCWINRRQDGTEIGDSSTRKASIQTPLVSTLRWQTLASKTGADKHPPNNGATVA